MLTSRVCAAASLVSLMTLGACEDGDATAPGTDDADTTLDAPGDAVGDDAFACEPFVPVPSPPATPPWSGTAFLDPAILTEADPSALVELVYTGQGLRTMYDRRSESFVMLNAHLFAARFGASTTVEVQVNPEMTQAEAEIEARFYATAVGRLPAFLFADLDTMWIHRGQFPFGGGNRNLLVHTEQGLDYVRGGYLEEVLLHEGTHTSIDGDHATTEGWLAAQAADGAFVSTYARDNPTREDLAETMVPYLAQRFWSDRVPAATIDLIRATVPNRLRYLDCLALSASPPL